MKFLYAFTILTILYLWTPSIGATSCEANANNCTACIETPGCMYCGVEAMCVNATYNGTCGPRNDCAVLPVSTVDVNAHCEDFDSTQCIGTVFYNVFVNQTFGQAQMAHEVGLKAAFAGLPGVTDQCRAVGVAVNCGYNYQKCVTLPKTNVAVSIPPCRSICEGFNTYCSPILGLTLDCLAVDPVRGGWVFPVDNMTYYYNNTLYNYKCNNMVPSALDIGYFPNKLTNGDFSMVTNETADSWTQLNPANPATVTTENSTNVLELSGSTGIYQTVILNKSKVLPIRVAGISKSVGVTGIPNEDYAVYADIYHNDGSVKRITANFQVGNNNYTIQEATYTPPVPIASINYTVIFNNHNGTAYFQEVAFQEKIPNVSTTFQCFAPLKFNPNWQKTNTAPCAIPCGSSELFDNPSLAATVFPMTIALSWIGIICTSLLIITWSIFPIKRNYPERLVLFFSISAWLLDFQGILGTGSNAQSLVCKDDFTYRTQSDALCGGTAVLLQLGATSTLAWWMCITFHTYIMVRFHMKHSYFKGIERYFHIISWTYAGLSTIIPLAAGKFGGIMGFSGCWLSDEHHSVWQLVTLFVPMGVCLIACVSMLVHACYIVVNVRSAVTNKSSKIGRHIRTYIRFGGFIFIAMFVSLTVFSYKMYLLSNEDKWERISRDSVICQVKGGTIEQCGKVSVSTWGYWWNYFGLHTFGVFIFVFFGFTKKNYILWRNLFLTVLRKLGLYDGDIINPVISASKQISASERSNSVVNMTRVSTSTSTQNI